jgi:hypothetical protein
MQAVASMRQRQANWITLAVVWPPEEEKPAGHYLAARNRAKHGLLLPRSRKRE